MSQEEPLADTDVLGKKFEIGLGFLGTCVASVAVMQLTILDSPCSVEVISPLLYGQVPEQPVWEGGLYLDLFLPSSRRPSGAPAVLYLHAGGWRSGDRSYGMYPWHAPILAANGFVVASASYRFTDVAPFPAQLHDAKAAVRWLRANAITYGIDPDRIGVWGDSAGGHLAALLATTADRADLEGDCGSPRWSSTVQSAVTRCAPTDFRTFLPDDPWAASVLDSLFGGPPATTGQLRDLASPLLHVSRESAPFLIVHGSRDETVPVEQARTMAEELRGHNVDVVLHEIEGVFHNLTSDIDPPWGSDPWTDLSRLTLEHFRRTLT